MNGHRSAFLALATASVSVLAPVAGAQAAEPGPYVMAGVGLDSMPDRDVTVNVTSRGVVNQFPSSSTWKSGWGVLAGVGYKWDFGLRTELEFSDRLAKVKAFGTNAWWGSQWDNSLMANVLYDIDTGTGFTPYLGGGIGASHISWGDNFRAAGPTIYDGESTRVGWQGIVGVSYAITPQIDLTLDGRIKGSFGDYLFSGSTTGSSITGFNYMTRSVFMGVRYAFGSDGEAPPAPPPPEAAQSHLGPYLAIGGGYDGMPDHDIVSSSASASGVITGHPLSSQWKSAWGVLAAIGYKWDFGGRTELEYSDRLSKVRDFNNVNLWWGNQWDNSLFVNALYDIDTFYGFTPFFGGGIGASHISWGANFRGKGATIYDGESTRFGWQGIVGVSYAVTPNIDVALDGRYKASVGAYSFAGSVNGSSISGFNYSTRSLFLSVRYSFGG